LAEPRTPPTAEDAAALDQALQRMPLFPLPDVRRAKALFRGYYEALSDELERVRDLGGEVKDVETGLVDFPARRLGEEILLCWRLGEKKVGFWHPLEGGFAARLPVDQDVTRTAQPSD